MEKTFAFIQITVSILLSISILLQNRGSGLSATFGGDFSSFQTKRGLEKFLFIATVVLSVGFIANALATIIAPSF